MLKTRSPRRLLLLLLVAGLSLSGCLPGGGAHTSDDPAGFFAGIWHGWIAPLSLLVGLFRADVRVYEVLNKGWGYDFGFYIAIIGGFGGLSLTRRRLRATRRRES
jgi:hypothetical protein